MEPIQPSAKEVSWKRLHAKKPQQDESFIACHSIALVQSFLAAYILRGSQPYHSTPIQHPASNGDRLFIFCTNDEGNSMEQFPTPSPAWSHITSSGLPGDMPQRLLSQVVFIYALGEYLRNGQGELIWGQNKSKWLCAFDK